MRHVVENWHAWLQVGIRPEHMFESPTQQDALATTRRCYRAT